MNTTPNTTPLTANPAAGGYDHPYPTAPLPEISEKDLSREVAVAGIAARQEAAAMGADPAQVEAVMQAAAASEPAGMKSKRPTTRVNGLELHGMTLAVGMALQRFEGLAKKHEAETGDLMTDFERLAGMVTVLTNPLEARKMSFEQHIECGLEMAKDWEAKEFEAFNAFAASLTKA